MVAIDKPGIAFVINIANIFDLYTQFIRTVNIAVVRANCAHIKIGADQIEAIYRAKSF